MEWVSFLIGLSLGAAGASLIWAAKMATKLERWADIDRWAT